MTGRAKYDPEPEFSTAEITVVIDPGDPNGVDARGMYVETYWLPILGPSTIIVARRLTAMLAEGEASTFGVHDFGLTVGLTSTNRVKAALVRPAHFGIGSFNREAALLRMPLRWPTLPGRLRGRLPGWLLYHHDHSSLEAV